MNKAAATSPRSILALCAVAYASIYIARHNLSMASPLLARGGYMTVLEIGLTGSIFFTVYAVGRFINGYVGDAVSPKKLLVGGLALVAAANVGIGFLPPMALIMLLWGVNALAQSMLWGPSLRLVNEAYGNSPRRRTAIVVLSASIGVGSLLAIVLSSVWAGVGLWALFAGPGLLAAVVCLFVTRLPKPEGRPVRPDLRQALLLFKKKDILCMLFPAVAHGAIKENLVLWAPLLFLNMYGIDLASAAMFVFLMPGATLLGRALYPLAERLCRGDERRVTLLAFGCCILCLAPFFLWKPPAALTAALLAATMLAVSVINVAFMAVSPVRFEAGGQVSMVAGLLDSIAYVGSAAGAAVFGWIAGPYGYLPMIGVYAVICLLSIGSMLPMVIKKRVHENEGAVVCPEKQR